MSGTRATSSSRAISSSPSPPAAPSSPSASIPLSAIGHTTGKHRHRVGMSQGITLGAVSAEVPAAAVSLTIEGATGCPCAKAAYRECACMPCRAHMQTTPPRDASHPPTAPCPGPFPTTLPHLTSPYAAHTLVAGHPDQDPLANPQPFSPCTPQPPPPNPGHHPPCSLLRLCARQMRRRWALTSSAFSWLPLSSLTCSGCGCGVWVGVLWWVKCGWDYSPHLRAAAWYTCRC